MWQRIWAEMEQLLTHVGLRLIAAIAVLVVGIWLGRKLVDAMFRKNRLTKMDASVHSFLHSAVKILLYVLVVIIAAGILGIPMTSFITVLASAGVAIGLALQGSLANFAGGLMILLFKPFQIGDYIETDKYAGEVREINVFYTLLVTYDKKHITLPNGTLSNGAVINHFTEPIRRLDCVFHVAYDRDIAYTERTLLDAAAKIPYVLSDPAPVVHLSENGESSLDFTLRVWSESAHYWDVDAAIHSAVKQALDQAQIKMPYPQMDIHLKR